MTPVELIWIFPSLSSTDPPTLSSALQVTHTCLDSCPSSLVNSGPPDDIITKIINVTHISLHIFPVILMAYSKVKAGPYIALLINRIQYSYNYMVHLEPKIECYKKNFNSCYIGFRFIIEPHLKQILEFSRRHVIPLHHLLQLMLQILKQCDCITVRKRLKCSCTVKLPLVLSLHHIRHDS